MNNVCSVTLRPVGEEDHALLSDWSSSRAWAYASGAVQYLNPEAFKEFIQNTPDEFLMVHTNDGQPIGAVSWRTGAYPGSFVIGTMIGDEAMWGAGLGFDSVLLLIRYLFDTKNAHRIEFKCGVFNLNAVQLFCAGNMQIEGVLRDYYFLDGEFHDALVGSILLDRYHELRSSNRFGHCEDTVPRAEKVKARALLREYLLKNPIQLRGEEPDDDYE